MRIAHFVQAFSALTETFIYDAILEMERQGAECRVFTGNRVHADDRPFEATTVLQLPPRSHPARVIRKVISQVRGDEAGAHVIAFQQRALRRNLQAYGPDVLHAHFGPAGAIAAPVAKSLGIPLAVTFYGYDITRYSVLERLKGQYSEMMQSAALLIGVSDHICQRIVQAGGDPEKVIRVRLGVDVDRFRYSDPARRFDGRKVRCLHVGRLTAKKSPVELVRAFHIATELVPSDLRLTLDIIGDGELTAETRVAISDLSLEERVRLHGAMAHDDVRRAFGRAHIYTQHSVTAHDGDQEGQPVSLIEAAASGLPIVSTRHSGIPELVIDGETGYLVGEHDVESMGAGIAKLAMNPDSWPMFGRRGRARVQDSFNLHGETEKLLAQFRHCSEGQICAAANLN